MTERRPAWGRRNSIAFSREPTKGHELARIKNLVHQSVSDRLNTFSWNICKSKACLVHRAQKWLQYSRFLKVTAIEEYTVSAWKGYGRTSISQSCVQLTYTWWKAHMFSCVFASNLVTKVVQQYTSSYTLVPCWGPNLNFFFFLHFQSIAIYYKLPPSFPTCCC